MEDGVGNDLSVILRRIMSVRKLGQAEVAALLGTTQSTVSRTLSGKFLPRRDVQLAIVKLSEEMRVEDGSLVRTIVAELSDSPELEALVARIVENMHKSA